MFREQHFDVMTLQISEIQTHLQQLSFHLTGVSTVCVRVTVEKLMTDATDDDFRWIGREAVQKLMTDATDDDFRWIGREAGSAAA